MGGGVGGVGGGGGGSLSSDTHTRGRRDVRPCSIVDTPIGVTPSAAFEPVMKIEAPSLNSGSASGP